MEKRRKHNVGRGKSHIRIDNFFVNGIILLSSTMPALCP